MALIRDQRKEGFDMLYANYADALYGVILKSVQDTAQAEDLMQEVFIKIWRSIDKYDPARSRLYTWMIRIARNACIDHLRSPGNKNLRNTREKTEDIQHLPCLKDREIDYGLMDVIGRMEPKYRDVIHTIFYHNYSHAEAAEVLGLPLGTLKTRVRMALLMLRSSLQPLPYE